jgi:ABC-type cobalamin/Fe3+-siderophores transport system ATPase subunit
MDECIDCARVNVKLNKTPVLKDINLKISRGEFVCVAGRSGSGKTTLLRTLLGFNKIDSGTIKVAGCDVSGGETAALRKRTGYLPQSIEGNYSISPFTARDVINMGAKGEKARLAVEELKIGDILSRRFSTLSGGEKQKVLLAMALSRRPGVILLDEPNLNLDMVSYADFISLVETTHKAHGQTIVLVTHLTDRLPEACKRVIVMGSGAITRDCGRDEFMKTAGATVG